MTFIDPIIEELNRLIAEGKCVQIRDVYDKLSIFDWFKETLSVKNMKDMRSFLETAKDFGFTGYACFKVGASGYANGMWAHTDESKDGYSPDTGDVLYRSFTPDYIEWEAKVGGAWVADIIGTKKRENVLRAVRYMR